MQINKITLPIALALRQVGKRLRFRGWERVLRLLFNPTKQSKFQFQVPFGRLKYPAYANNFIDWNVLFYSSYETYELKLLSLLSSKIKDSVFIDVGANVGHHSLFMSCSAKQIHAFEPNPELWPFIMEKISANNIQNIVLHKRGLGNVSDKLPLYLKQESGEASLILGTNDTDTRNHVTVKIVPGDKYFENIKLKKIDLIKLDIEGSEKQAIEGMDFSIRKWRPMIMLEISESGKDHFDSFDSFIDMFPNEYVFYFCYWSSRLLIRKVLRQANEKRYKTFSGNAFCIPIEKRKLFLDTAGIE